MNEQIKMPKYLDLNGHASKEWLEVLKFLDELILKVETRSITASEAANKAISSISLSTLNALPGSADPVRDEIAFAIQGLSITSWNKQEDIVSALKLIDFCTQIQTSPEAKEVLLQDKNGLREIEAKYRGILTCYFCETHLPDDKSKIDKRLYLVTKRQHLGVVRRVEYSHFPVSIPQCAACQKLHKKGKNIVRLSTWIGALLGLIGLLYGVIICGVIGYFIGRRLEKRLYTQNKIKSAYKSSLNKHPLVAQKVQEGWTFTKPT